MNIYCANLAYTCTDDELKDAFSEYGEVVSAKIITDRETRRSRGFGFVEMPDQAAAEAAIEALNESFGIFEDLSEKLCHKLDRMYVN